MFQKSPAEKQMLLDLVGLCSVLTDHTTRGTITSNGRQHGLGDSALVWDSGELGCTPGPATDMVVDLGVMKLSFVKH